MLIHTGKIQPIPPPAMLDLHPFVTDTNSTARV